MRLPRTSRSYTSTIEETYIGRGDYIIGGATSPAFLDLDGAKHRRPVVFGHVSDSEDDYPSIAASIFPGERKDLEGWAASWTGFGIDGLRLELSKSESAELVKEISDATMLPIMVTAPAGILREISSINDTRMILESSDGQSIGSFSGDHLVVEHDDEIQDAKRIVKDLGKGRMDSSLKDLKKRIEQYRLDGLSGIERCDKAIVCDVTGSWSSFTDETTEREATLIESSTALTAMIAGADVIIIKGPGAADMSRVYGEELGL